VTSNQRKLYRRVGSLTVLDGHDPDANGSPRAALVICDCSTVRIVPIEDLRPGGIKFCGDCLPATPNRVAL
jgi:hypothetical protein